MSAHGAAQPLAGLWLVRELPYPADSGDRIYSSNLIESVARAGAQLTVLGLKAEGDPPGESASLNWQAVNGTSNGLVRSLASALPLVTARHATASYRKILKDLGSRHWDFIVLDHYGVAWVLPELRRMIDRADACVAVHISHNRESVVSADLARQFSGRGLKKLGLWLNHYKIRALEHRITKRVDLLCAITDEDAEAYRQVAPRLPVLTLPPGYSGETSNRVRIDAATPRRVLMIGSYHWVPKQENLRQFLRVADPVLHAAGVELHIIGSIPVALREQLQSETRAAKFLGFVDDLAPHLRDARMAVVPELIGGGFKLKSLTYVFGRMPVVALRGAAAGLPTSVREHQIERDRLDELAPAIISAIDRIDVLNQMQHGALAAAQDQFNWDLRGLALMREIRQIRSFASAAHRTGAEGR